MDSKDYITVDEVGDEAQVRIVDSFKPTTAAEEIEYLNKILAKMERCEVKENSKEEKHKLQNRISENDAHKYDRCNNEAVSSLMETSVCADSGKKNSECAKKFLDNDNRDKIHVESCSTNEIIDGRNLDLCKSDIEGYGLPCADDILTQAENQHSVNQDSVSGHVRNELSTEPNLIMANFSVTDLECNSRQKSCHSQINICSIAECEEKLETCNFESKTLEALNENGSSELSSSTTEATIMPVNCAAESSSVLESGHYSAKDTLDSISGEDISGSSDKDSEELDHVSTLNNVILGDIGSLLKSSADDANVTEKNTDVDCETQVDLSIVKSEPVFSDPGEEFNLKECCSDPAEEFVLKDHSVKEEPLEYSPPAPMINQEEVLLPVENFKNENDSDDQVITPNIRYLIETHKNYSREEVSAALIISQSSLSTIIDMEMFQNLGKTKLIVTLNRLENVIKRPKQLALEDFNIVQLFRSNHGTSIEEWKKFFNFKRNYSVKRTGKKDSKKHTSSKSSDKSSDRKKGKRGRKKKGLTTDQASEIKKEAKHTSSRSSSVCPTEESVPLQVKEESFCGVEESLKVETESNSNTVKEENEQKNNKTIELVQEEVLNVNDTSNDELSIKNEKDIVTMQYEEASNPSTLKDDCTQENEDEKQLDSHIQNYSCKPCYVYLHDIAKDPIYGDIVMNHSKQNIESRGPLECSLENHTKESSNESEIPSFFDDSIDGDDSFLGFSPVKLEDQISLQTEEESEDLAANIQKVDFVEEVQQKASHKDGSITFESDESLVKKEISEIDVCKKNTNEVEVKLERKPDTKAKERHGTDVRMKAENRDEGRKRKEEKKARKRLKLEEYREAKYRDYLKDRKNTSEADHLKDKSGGSWDDEGQDLKDDKKKDGDVSVEDPHDNLEDISSSKDRNPTASPLSALSTFKIPKKKVPQVLEQKTQAQNSMLCRRGETPSAQKSVGYFSNKRFSTQNKKGNGKEREASNVKTMKKEMKPVLPACTQQPPMKPINPPCRQPPVVEGWVKRPATLNTECYPPQSGFTNMPNKNSHAAPVAPTGHVNAKSNLEAMTHVNLYSNPHAGYSKPNLITKAEHSNLPDSKYKVGNLEKPVKEICISLNVPPPPLLDKLDFTSPKAGQSSGSTQPLVFEASPAMSHGNSSDEEGDGTGICKVSQATSQLPPINVTRTHSSSSTASVTATPNETLKENVQVVTTHNEPSREKASEGKSKDHYEYLDKKQKIKLYEKRKRYYYESKKRFHAEKGDKKKVWYKEYEKRKNEYYHLKIYLYKEKKKEYMEEKLRRSSKTHNKDKDQTSVILKKDSEPSKEAEASEQCKSSGNTTVESGEIPYSPTGSPIDYAEDFCYIDVNASLLDDTPRKVGEDKDQEGKTLLNYPTEKLKEMIMQVMNTIGQQSHNRKGDSINQSADTPAKSIDCEPKIVSDKSRPLNKSSIPLESEISDTLPVPSISTLSLPQTSTMNKIPLPVPPPTLAPLPLPQFVSSEAVHQKSVSRPPVSSLGASSSQSVPQATSISSTLNQHLNEPSAYLGNNSSQKLANTSELLSYSAQSPMAVKSHLNSTPTSDPAKPAEELCAESERSASKDSEHSSFLCDGVFPPLPASPPPPPPAEEISESVDERDGRLHESNVVDDMTEVPMEIDSDDEIYRCEVDSEDEIHDDHYDLNTDSRKIDSVNETPDYHDRKEDDSIIDSVIETPHYRDRKEDDSIIDSVNEMPDYHDRNEDDSIIPDGHANDMNEMSDCHHKDKGSIQMTKVSDDKEYLSMYGVSQDELPPVEKEAPIDSTDDTRFALLLKKLMKVTRNSLQQGDFRSDRGKKVVTSNITQDKPNTSLNTTLVNQQKRDGCNIMNEQDSPSVPSLNTDRIMNPVPSEDIQMKIKAKETEEISSGCHKQDEQVMLSENTQSGSLNEIEILGKKEPPKNLICVDEILLSVEAADQPPDLQIIYTDIRSEPRDRRNMIRDEVPKYYQKTALAQVLVDRCKDIPLVGLQYVLEVRKDVEMTLDGCYYICAVCSKKMTAHTLLAHIKSVPHRLKFTESHCKHIYDKYGTLEFKEWTGPLVKEFTIDLAEVGKKMGRHKLAVAVEREMSSVLKSLKQKISDISNLSKLQEETGKVSVGQAASGVTSQAKNVSASVTPKAKDVVKDALPDSTVQKDIVASSVLSSKDIPLPPTPKSQGSTARCITDEKNEEEEDVIVVATTKKNATDTKKFSSNGQGFTKRKYRPGPNSRRRNNSGSTTPTLSSPRKSRSRSRSNSMSPKINTSQSPANKLAKHSRSPPRRKPDRPPYASVYRKRRHSRSPSSPHHQTQGHSKSSSRDTRKRYRTRSRSRSRHRSPQRRKDGWPRHFPKRESSEERARRVARMKLEDFREEEMSMKAKHKNLQIAYEKTPESHPLYDREWKIFWESRCRELEKEGVDPFLHDFKSEWARFWRVRMKELMDIHIKAKRDALLKKLRMKDPDLEENDKPKASQSWTHDSKSVERISRIDRSPSPWEQDDGPAIARNPSPAPGEVVNITQTKDSLESNEMATHKFEDDFSVIGTLKLLNELEDQLGSFGPAISTLLGKAVDCSQKGEDTLDLFKDPDNLVLVRYAREKLTSQITAGILGVTALVRTQMAVERSMWLQSQAERLANEGRYLGLDIAGIAKSTVGKDTVQIAQYIALHLLQVGKSNANEADLQNILYAVLAAHTKLLVESSTKNAKVDSPVKESVAPVSAPVMPVCNDPPKDLSSASNDKSEGTKQPLFPSAAPAETSGADKTVDDGDDESSDKLGCGLSLLQHAYDEEHGKEMENLSLDDLRSLLANFNSLSREEKQALTTYLKKLEATDSKKVMKLREEIQKSAKSTSKSSNIKLKSGKLVAQTPSVPNSDSSNNQVSQQEVSEAAKVSTLGKQQSNEKPLLQTSSDQNTRLPSLEKVNEPLRSSQDRFSGNPEIDGTHDSREVIEPSTSLDGPAHAVLPPPMGEMEHNFGSNINHKSNFRPHPLDQPGFDDDPNRPFNQRAFMERQEPGFGNHVTNFNRFDYESVHEPNNHDRYDRPSEPDNPRWRGFNRGGPPMGDHGFPPQDERNFNWFDDGQQPRFDNRDFAFQGRPGYPYRGGPHRGQPNRQQPYRDPW